MKEPKHPRDAGADHAMQTQGAQVFVVGLAVSPTQYANCEQLLTPDELSRADRYLFEDIRRRYIVCRGALRQLLASRLDCDPADLRFRYEKWGKPVLADSGKPRLHFNVSHSGEWALIGLAKRPLGVDLEVPNERISNRAIASQILSPSEQVQWQQFSARQQEASVMPLWVCKEALLKAMGLGIAEGLQQISFALPVAAETVFSPVSMNGSLQMHLEDDGTCRTNHWVDAAAWQLRMLDAVPECFACICTPREIRHVSLTHYSVG